MGNCCLQSGTDTDLIVSSDVYSREVSRDPTSGPPPPYQEHNEIPLQYPPGMFSVDGRGDGRQFGESSASEEEQIRIALRIGLIQHLPTDVFVEGSKTDSECVICMTEFMTGDPIRFLPCLHTYHAYCIDDWLMRSFTCPSCMQPVDAALLTSYHGAVGPMMSPGDLPLATPPRVDPHNPPARSPMDHDGVVQGDLVPLSTTRQDETAAAGSLERQEEDNFDDGGPQQSAATNTRHSDTPT